jgi:hypothetical protein
MYKFHKSRKTMKGAILLAGILAVTVSCNRKQKALEQEMTQMKVEMQQQRTQDSLKAVYEEEKVAAVAAASARSKVYNRTSTNTAATPEEAKKKGMSTPLKGALIGAGAGALTGAAVSKKKGKGALIGAAVGAGAGAGTGVIIDKQKEKKEAENK